MGTPVDAQANNTIPLCTHSAFSAEKGEQMIVISFNDVTMFACAARSGVYKESMHEPQDIHLGFWN